MHLQIIVSFQGQLYDLVVDIDGCICSYIGGSIRIDKADI